MVFIDPRAGSGEFLTRLEQQHLQCSLRRMDFGDFAWVGNGQHGPGTVAVVVERKTITDFLSSMEHGRLTNQIHGMVGQYDVAYLIVEGIWREDPHSGMVQTYYGGGWTSTGFLHTAIDSYLVSIEALCGGRLFVHHTQGEMATVRHIRNLYHWWQKDWNNHGSLATVYAPPPPVLLPGRPNLVARVAFQVDGIGWGKAVELAHRYLSVKSLVEADPKDLRAVPGIGRELARRIYTAFNERMGRQLLPAKVSDGTDGTDDYSGSEN